MLAWCVSIHADRMLIPMDFKQSDHLKAYGVAYHALKAGRNVEWLLNYRGGSFLLDIDREIEEYALARGVAFENLDAAALLDLDGVIQNAHVKELEKGPEGCGSHAAEPEADDAVTMALTYKNIL